MNEKTRIFLFETSVEEQNKEAGRTKEGNDTPFPLGILYLDAILKKNGYKVLTKDYTAWSEEHCLKEIDIKIKEFKPDTIGITVMSMTRVSTYKAIKLIKKINPNIKIILGGIHASAMYKQLLENFPIEAIIIGEADKNIIELIEAMINNRSLKNIKGLAYKKNNKVIVTEKIPLDKNIDDLPYPNYDVYLNPKIKRVQMISSRGCPNKCSFCCLHITSRQIWRPRNHIKVVNEIEYVKKKFPWIEEIQFMDDTMTLDNERMINICKEIIKRGIKLRFYCAGRVKPVSKEMFYWMEKAGFKEIAFGIESGSGRILKTLHKNITKEDCIKAFNLLKEFKELKPVRFLIVGFPGETEETINETLEFSKKLQRIRKMDFFYVSPLWIYPETEIYKIAVERGFINDDFWLTNKPCPLFTLDHSEQWLMKMSNKIVIQTMLVEGKLYFLKRLIEKILQNPKYYFERLLTLRK